MTYLLQPKKGGTDTPIPIIHVHSTTAKACFEVKVKLPIGLQITIYLSKARKARDHPVTSPKRKWKPTMTAMYS